MEELIQKTNVLLAPCHNREYDRSTSKTVYSIPKSVSYKQLYIIQRLPIYLATSDCNMTAHTTYHAAERQQCFAQCSKSSAVSLNLEHLRNAMATKMHVWGLETFWGHVGHLRG